MKNVRLRLVQNQAALSAVEKLVGIKMNPQEHDLHRRVVEAIYRELVEAGFTEALHEDSIGVDFNKCVNSAALDVIKKFSIIMKHVGEFLPLKVARGGL